MNKSFVKWKGREIVTPTDAVNYALSVNGAKSSASNCENGFTADGVNNGEKTMRGWGDGNGWKTPLVWHPSWWGEWVRIDFPNANEIDTIIVYNCPQMVIDRPWWAMLHYKAQYLNENHEWITISTIRHNKEDINVISFEKVKVLSIRIYVDRNHYREEKGYEKGWFEYDESPRFLEVEAYCLNGEQVYKECSGEKEVIHGAKGNAAIFFDEDFCENSRIEVKKLAGWLENWGYGVTYLTADDLCRKEIFCACNFTLFVHPYGTFFPIGTNIYDFLMGGGHLMTFGGRAFTTAMQKVDGKWINLEMDPEITVSGARYIDYFRPYRDQLGIFTVPGSRFERVVKIASRDDQSISKHTVEVSDQIEGWMALSVVGELQPLDETRRLTKQGRMPEVIHIAREGVNQNKADIPLLWDDALDENYASVTSFASSRWIPLLDSFDDAGRNRGPVLSIMPHYHGMYKGSSWLFCGVENVDVLQWENMEKMLHDAVDYLHAQVIAHSLEPSYSCYRKGEVPEFSIIVDSSSNESVIIELEIKVFGCGSSNETLFSTKDSLTLEPGGWKRLDYNCGKSDFVDDFYKIVATIMIDGKTIDCLESGFVIWNQDVLKQGPNVEFKDNFFHFDGKSRYVTGTRCSGLHMPWNPETNALGWDKRYSMLRDFGMQITSPVHMDWFFPGLGWGEQDQNQPIPEIILRQMDAQVQLAQKHKIIYAPCIFFVYEKIALQKPDITRRICEVLGERYKEAPGIIFIIWDDGLRHDPALFNDWVQECVDGFNACGREYMVTAEIGFRQTWPDAMRRSAKNLTFSNGSNFRISVGDPVYERIIDLRPAGKSFTLGEFVRRIPMGTPDDFHGYLAPVHVNFGMGYAMAMNWKWSTAYHAIWPSDVVFPGNNVPKKHLYAFRNEALFFRIFEPVYKSPPFILVMPSVYWLKNSESMTNYMVGLLRHLLELKLDFACIDEEDLKLLPKDSTRGILLPMPLEYTDEAYEEIKSFVDIGGNAFIIGDLGKINSELEGDTSPEWLSELCGIIHKGDAGDNRGRSLFMDRFMPRRKVVVNGNVYETLSWIDMETGWADVEFKDESGCPVLTRYNYGKGAVWFLNDLNTEFPAEFLQNFLAEAQIDRMQITPNIPTLYCFKADTVDGPVYSMFTYPWDQSVHHVTLSLDHGEINTVLKEQSMGVYALTEDSKSIYAVEAQGDVSLNGRKIVSTSAHIMLAAIDKKDIASSDAILMLPVVNPGKVTVYTKSDVVELGEFVGGGWKTFKTIQCDSEENVEITITDNDLSKLFFITNSTKRDDAVKLLESVMLN